MNVCTIESYGNHKSLGEQQIFDLYEYRYYETLSLQLFKLNNKFQMHHHVNVLISN